MSEVFDSVKTKTLVVTGSATFIGTVVIPNVSVTNLTFSSPGTTDTGNFVGLTINDRFALAFECTQPPFPPEERLIFHCPDVLPLPPTNPALQIPGFPSQVFPGGILSSLGVAGYDTNGFIAPITFAELATLISVDFSCDVITGNPACITAIGTALLGDSTFQTGICNLVSTTCLISIEDALLADNVFISDLSNTLFANPTFITNLTDFISGGFISPTFESYALAVPGIASAADQPGVEAFTRVSNITGPAAPGPNVCIPIWVFNTTPNTNYKVELNTTARNPANGDGYASEVSFLIVATAGAMNIMELRRDEVTIAAPPASTPGSFAGSSLTASNVGNTLTFSLCPFIGGTLPGSVTISSRINVERTPA